MAQAKGNAPAKAPAKAPASQPGVDAGGIISGIAQGAATAISLFQDTTPELGTVGFTGFEDEDVVGETLSAAYGSVGSGSDAVLGSVSTGLLSGVTAGLAIGGVWGSVIGGAVGLIGGLFGGFGKKRAAKKAAARARARAIAQYKRKRRQAQEKKQVRLEKERLEVQKMMTVGRRQAGTKAKSLLDQQAQNVAEYNKILGLTSGTVKSGKRQRIKNAAIRAQAAVSGQYRYATAKVDKLNRLEELLTFESGSAFEVNPGTLKYRDALQSAVQEFEEF